MSEVLLTGMNGTVAPVVAEELRGRGCQVVAWDRGAVSPDDREGVAQFVREVNPSALVHCAMGSPQWAEDMARVCAEEGSKFLYVSSASVYGTQQQGPFTIYDTPVPGDDYGRYKLECEQRVRAANEQAIVVRIGWQMALRCGGCGWGVTGAGEAQGERVSRPFADGHHGRDARHPTQCGVASASLRAVGSAGAQAETGRYSDQLIRAGGLPTGLGRDGRDARAPCPNHKLAGPP